MKLLTTLAAAGAVCLTLAPDDANAQRRGYYSVGGYAVRAPIYSTYAAYRPYYGYRAYRPYYGYRYAAYRPYWGGYRYAAYRPYGGWGIGAAYASAAYVSAGLCEPVLQLRLLPGGLQLRLVRLGLLNTSGSSRSTLARSAAELSPARSRSSTSWFDQSRTWMRRPPDACAHMMANSLLRRSVTSMLPG